MKKFILAALLALPFLAAPPKAAAQCCGSCEGGGLLGPLACMKTKICTYANALHSCGCGHNVPWQGGFLSCFSCPGRIPGPWYLYWPNDGAMVSGYAYGNGANWWSLENHFVAPAPTGYANYPAPMGISASWAAPGGSCPSYWYGR